MATKERERLRVLVEGLPDELVRTAMGILEVLVKESDAVLQALEQAPVDDEPLSEAGRRALDEAWEDLHRGEKPIPDEEVRQRLGIG